MCVCHGCYVLCSGDSISPSIVVLVNPLKALLEDQV